MLFPLLLGKSSPSDGCSLPCSCRSDCTSPRVHLRDRDVWMEDIVKHKECYAGAMEGHGFNLYPASATEYQKQCCDFFWMPPIQFQSIDAICDVSYKMVPVLCDESSDQACRPPDAGPSESGTRDHLLPPFENSDDSYLRQECAERNLNNTQALISWSIHWTAVFKMPVSSFNKVSLQANTQHDRVVCDAVLSTITGIVFVCIHTLLRACTITCTRLLVHASTNSKQPCQNHMNADQQSICPSDAVIPI